MKERTPLGDITKLPAALKVDEAARLLGVSRSTVYAAITRGDLTALHLGRSIRLSTTAVLRLLNGESTSEQGGRLTAAEALSFGQSYATTAEVAGVPVSTLKEWMADPEFIDMVNRLMASQSARVQAMVRAALVEVTAEPGKPPKP